MLVLAWISLAALVVVIVLSCTSTVNPGFLALALAWLIGIYVAPACGRTFTVREILEGFPTDLFVTLVGVTLLFTLARGNGTLDRLVHVAVRECRGNTGLIPILFFGLSCGVASVGAGNIAAAALVAPLAMAVGERARIPPFLMTIMVAHGCIAGALSPIAPTGIVASGLMQRMGMSGFERQIYLSNLAANAVAAVIGYLVFGGRRLFGQRYDDGDVTATEAAAGQRLSVSQWVTLAAIAMLVVGVVGFGMHVGLWALAIAVVLILVTSADERSAIAGLPWSVTVMVCGVTVLTALLEKTGGIKAFTAVMAQVATPRSIAGLMALVSGLVSLYSSTVGVVLPALLPSVPDLVARLGGGNPSAIAASILIGGHLVDVSPLSTIGALCIASVPVSSDRRLLFNQVLVWGLAMSVLGALGCYIVFL
jgi:Na+/H+ antiporter NhaD/arsenite permease-like protein